MSGRTCREHQWWLAGSKLEEFVSSVWLAARLRQATARQSSPSLRFKRRLVPFAGRDAAPLAETNELASRNG